MTDNADGLTRWARSVGAVLQAEHDPKTTAGWAELLGVAPETLRTWCRTVRLPVKPSLDLARLLRSVSRANRCACGPDRFLNVAHPRTLRRLLKAGGVDDTRCSNEMELLDCQTLIGDRMAVAELRRQLVEHNIVTHDLSPS